MSYKFASYSQQLHLYSATKLFGMVLRDKEQKLLHVFFAYTMFLRPSLLEMNQIQNKEIFKLMQRKIKHPFCKMKI